MAMQCDQPLCQETATHTYTWQWGQSGVVCERHRTVLQQTSENLGRTITFAPIDPAATPPLQREERVRLRSEAMVLQEELNECKQRGLDMYRQIERLQDQVRTLTVTGREAEAQLRDLSASQENAVKRATELEVENAELVEEIGRLRVLLPPLQPSQQHVVE